MNQVVHIDLASIKKNPNAGSTITHIPMGSELEFIMNAPFPEWLREDVLGWHLLEWDEFTENKNAVIYDPVLQHKFFEYVESLRGSEYRVKIEQKFNRQTIKHSPEPDYEFEYENPLLKCNGCGAAIHVQDIVRDCYDNDEGGYMSYEECPKCGDRDCFDYCFETIGQALKRKSNG